MIDRCVGDCERRLTDARPPRRAPSFDCRLFRGTGHRTHASSCRRLTWTGTEWGDGQQLGRTLNSTRATTRTPIHKSRRWYDYYEDGDGACGFWWREARPGVFLKNCILKILKFVISHVERLLTKINNLSATQVCTMKRNNQNKNKNNLLRT